MLIFYVPVFRSSDPAESALLIFQTGSQLVCLRDGTLVASDKTGGTINSVSSFLISTKFVKGAKSSF